MRNDEAAGRRPLYRPRAWHENKRAIEKESKKSSWSKNGQKPAVVSGAPLIICPQAGNSLTKNMKNICKNFLKDTNIDVKVVTRGVTRLQGILSPIH